MNQAWEKKEALGLIVLLVIFVVGIFVYKGLTEERRGWGELVAIKKNNAGVVYEVLVRTSKDKNRLFRETIGPKLTTRQKPIETKERGAGFPVKYTISDEREGKIVEVGIPKK